MNNGSSNASATAAGMVPLPYAEENMTRVGLGYGIAIAVGILVLVSTIMLASYVCVRVHGRAQLNALRMGQPSNPASILPQSVRINMDLNTGPWPVAGLDEATVQSYPKIIYTGKQSLPHSQDTSCSICLSDYKETETLRMLPDCRHAFHAQCIDSWLRLQASCPMCRTSPLPTPISTPLAEVIPLARHQLRSHMGTG